MKRIAIDCRFAAYPAGLGRYTRELVAHLVKRGDPQSYILLVQSLEEEWQKRLPDVERIAAPFPHYSLSEQAHLPRLLRSCEASLLFSPHFNVPFACPIPFVVTVHDLILHRFANAAPFWKRAAYSFVIRHAIRSARHVIAVSDFTAQEIRSVYGDGIPLSVIHEGVNEEFHPVSDDAKNAIRKKYGIHGPYFLYVGNAKEHKNVGLLLRAFASLPSPDYTLILVASGTEATSLTLPSGARLLQHVPDADLPALYGAASCFVSASLYEGFGLPLIEALACGCPVIAVNRAAIPEVTRGKAMLVEPTLDAFRSVLLSPPAPQSPVRLWKWDDAAEQTASLLHASMERSLLPPPR